jgi:hypothetical protein
MPWAADTPFFQHAANYSGGTPRIALIDGPNKVVNVIIRAALNPREEALAGWKARSAYVAHRVLPDTTERVAAAVSHHYQVTTAPPAPRTAGAVHEPIEAGRTIGGDVRPRMRAEARARRDALKKGPR